MVWNKSLLSQNETDTRALNVFMRSYYLTPAMIDENTRFSHRPNLNPTLFDHILINFKVADFSSGSFKVDNTDSSK